MPAMRRASPKGLGYFQFYAGTPEISGEGRVMRVPPGMLRPADLFGWYAESLSLGDDGPNFNALKWCLVPERVGSRRLHLIHSDVPLVNDPYEPDSHRWYLRFLLGVAAENDLDFEMWPHFPASARFNVLRGLS